MLIVKHPECLPSPVIIDLLRAVIPAAKAMNIPHCLIGAQSMALILHGVHGTKVSRISGDVDMAIVVQGWPQFDALKAALVQTGPFHSEKKAAHKLWYRSAEHNIELPLDLLPFGGVEIADQRGTIAWPPDHVFQMNVLGLNEAVNNSVEIQITEDLLLPVCSLSSFALLKLLAWQDRHTEMNKDAADLSFVTHHAEKTELFDRIYQAQHDQLLAICDYDPRQACARLLAHDMAMQITPNTWLALRGFCDSTALQQRMLDQLPGEHLALKAFLSQLQQEASQALASH